MTLLRWGWVKRGSSNSRTNNALCKCDTCCSFLPFFKCCHFNHRNGLEILLTLPESFYIWIACLSWNLCPYPTAQCSFLQKCYLFVSLLLSFSFAFDAEGLFFLSKFMDFIPESFQTLCVALQVYVAYESWLWKLLFTAFNSAIIYKLYTQYILVLVQFLLTSYHLRYSEYK